MSKELKLQVLEKFGCDGIEFCREAYKFLMESDECRSESPSANTEVKAVDLGLPSGLLWADRNIGAKNIEDCGLYFSWGNTEGHEERQGYCFSEDEYKITKGANLRSDIDVEHDAATVNLGAPWRMPTEKDLKELHDNTTSKWDKENGYVGLRLTSKVNGNSVFFPAAGVGYGTSLSLLGSCGYYWSSSFVSAADARLLNFVSSSVYPQYSYLRARGFSVRAVRGCHNK